MSVLRIGVLKAKERRKKTIKNVCGKQTLFVKVFFKHFQTNISRHTEKEVGKK